MFPPEVKIPLLIDRLLSLKNRGDVSVGKCTCFGTKQVDMYQITTREFEDSEVMLCYLSTVVI